MQDKIDYSELIQDAMLGVVRTVLQQSAAHGLPGDHHFMIVFATQYPGVAIADWLVERFPKEMVIVLQHEYEDLFVSEDQFSVTLRFDGVPEPLVIPFNAILRFMDPAVEFGVEFQVETPNANEVSTKQGDNTGEAHAPSDQEQDAQIVSLDQFRK